MKTLIFNGELFTSILLSLLKVFKTTFMLLHKSCLNTFCFTNERRKNIFHLHSTNSIKLKSIMFNNKYIII